MKDSSAVIPARIFRYRCPDGHETYVNGTPGMDKPLRTAVICKTPVEQKKPCNKFSLFAEGNT